VRRAAAVGGDHRADGVAVDVLDRVAAGVGEGDRPAVEALLAGVPGAVGVVVAPLVAGDGGRLVVAEVPGGGRAGRPVGGRRGGMGDMVADGAAAVVEGGGAGRQRRGREALLPA